MNFFLSSLEDNSPNFLLFNLSLFFSSLTSAVDNCWISRAGGTCWILIFWFWASVEILDFFDFLEAVSCFSLISRSEELLSLFSFWSFFSFFSSSFLLLFTSSSLFIFKLFKLFILFSSFFPPGFILWLLISFSSSCTSIEWLLIEPLFLILFRLSLLLISSFGSFILKLLFDSSFFVSIFSLLILFGILLFILLFILLLSFLFWLFPSSNSSPISSILSYIDSEFFLFISFFSEFFSISFCASLFLILSLLLLILISSISILLFILSFSFLLFFSILLSLSL